MSTKITTAHIQHDFKDCIEEQKTNNNDIEFYINVDKNSNEIDEYRVSKRNLEQNFDAGRDNIFKLESSDTAFCTLTDKTFRFQTPSNEYSKLFQDINWTAIDTTSVPDSSYVLGDSNGNIILLNENFNTERILTNAHSSDVSKVKFFPSGKVLLSGSNDMQIKIWSIEDGSNPRTFIGHKSQVTDLEIIERGRNFLSSSRDGTIKLWECGSGLNVHTLARKENPSDGINDLVLFDNLLSDSITNPTNNLEYGVQGKTVIAAHNSGVITMHDISTRHEQLQIPSKYMSSCNSISMNKENYNYVYAGYENGTVTQWDIRSPTTPVTDVSINNGASINTLYYSNSKLYISSGNDLSISLAINNNDGSINPTTPTFLVSEDNQISEYVLTPTNDKVISVGNYGFCGLYKV